MTELARPTRPAEARLPVARPAPVRGRRQEPWLPRLTWWGHTWRWVAMVLMSLVVFGFTVEQAGGEHDGQLLLDAGVGVVTFVLVPWRRRFPLGIAVLLTLAGAVSALSAGPGILAMLSLATRRRWPEVIGIGLLTVLVAQVWESTSPASSSDPWWLTLGYDVVIVAALLMAAMYAGSRRELLWSLRERADRAEAEQALRVEQARATERERIAREMHDVLGHRISLVTMHAGALSYREDLDHAQVADSARVILDNAQLAMTDLRSVLGVLRGDQDGVAVADDAYRPQPTLADLPTLVQEARDAGTAVELRCDLADLGAVPDRIGRTVYRVVQEGLTNVRKHAPGSQADVHVTGAPGQDLVVRVSNPAPSSTRVGATSSLGYGIVGLTERAELGGGRLRTRWEAGRFVLEVTLPWEP